MLHEYNTGEHWASSLTRVKDGFIAAAFRNQNQIKIFSCKNKFEVTNEINTTEDCRLYGIASFNEQSFLVSYREKTRVDILSHDGKTLKTFQQYIGKTPLFNDSRYIDVTANNVFVVDTTDRKLVCFYRDGSFRTSQERFSTEYHIMRGIHCGKKRNYVLVDATIKTFKLEGNAGNNEQIVTDPFISNCVGTTYMRSIAVDPSESAMVLIYASEGKEMVRIFGMLQT